MKKFKIFLFITLAIMVIYQAAPLIAKQLMEPYLLESEKNISVQEPGTHGGGGITTGYNFFSKTQDLKLVFKKRVLKPGSGIGYHIQKEDEIYYIVDGEGEMEMNGSSFSVKAGDAILTRPGSSHGLKVTGDRDLTIIINYEKH